MVIDKAMGLWIFHYQDIDTIVKKEDDDIKKEDDDIEDEGTSKQEDDNINKGSSETEDNSNNKNDNKDGKNKKDRKKESHSCLCRSGKILINIFCAYRNHLVQVRLNKDNLPLNQLSEMIQKQIQESVNKRAWNPITIHDDNVKELDDEDNIPHPLEYMESGFWEV